MDATTDTTSCARCGQSAADGPVFAEAGLVCWDCADDLLDQARHWKVGA